VDCKVESLSVHEVMAKLKEVGYANCTAVG